MVERTLSPENVKANVESAIPANIMATQPIQKAPPPPPPQVRKKSPTIQKKKVVRPTGTPKTATAASSIPGRGRYVSFLQTDTNITGLMANIRDMYQTRGLRAFMQGFFPTMFRQVANSAVQFTTYNFLKQLLHPKADEKMPVSKSLLAGFLSGAAVVLATQPLDVIKTRMQSINARIVYQSSPRAAYRIFVEEGVAVFWTGAIPRFLKICTGSAATFGIYEAVSNVLRAATKESPFQS